MCLHAHTEFDQLKHVQLHGQLPAEFIYGPRE